MGKAKTQRTEALHQAARRYVLAKQAVEAIAQLAQHNLDPEYKQGGGFEKGVTPQGGGVGFNHSVPRSVN